VLTITGNTSKMTAALDLLRMNDHPRILAAGDRP